MKDRETFSPFVDQFGAPAWAREVAQTTVKLVEKNAEGIFHFAYDDYASWAEVYELAVRELGYKVKLTPKLTAEVSLPAARPLFSVLSNKKLCAFLGIKGMGSWVEPLKRFLRIDFPPHLQ